MKVINELRRVRPYRWGAIYLFDYDNDDFLEGSIGPDGVVFPTPHWITIGVHHALTGAVPDDHPPDAPIPPVTVELVVRVQDEAADRAMYDEVIDLPSGVLVVGDANDDDKIRLHPGRWRMQINLDPPDEATKAEIILSLLGPAA